MKLGYIGQGYVGKNSSDDFENRGMAVVRYSLEEPYIQNKDNIKDCDVVFIAVPTPSTPEGFDDSIVREAVGLTNDTATIVIKSTIVPGTTDAIQADYPTRTIIFSPEFLSEATAAHDAANPIMNILGIVNDDADAKAKQVMKLLPNSPHNQICSAREAEIIKYAHNVHGFFKILYTNFIYDVVQGNDASWDAVAKAIEADPYIANQILYYNKPVHKSGRGAGGHCFIKDVAAFREHYDQVVKNNVGTEALKALEEQNIKLLAASGKNLDLLEGVYGKKKIQDHLS